MKFTIADFDKIYPNEDACLEKIFQDKYNKNGICEKCNKKTKFHKRSGIKCYSCQYCGHCIFPLVGTIFEKSSTSLKSWFFVIFLFSVSKNGVSAKEIERQLGVTYKCAWRICNKVRTLFADKNGFDSNSNNGNSFQVDETYYGGKECNKHMNKKTMNAQGRSLKKKIPIIGIVQQGGKIVAKVSQSTNNIAINKLLKKYVPINSEVHTDEYRGYSNLKKIGYKHKRCNHSRGKYVLQGSHTNTIEGFWSQLKRSVHGTYHAISAKYLQNYVDEFCFRYNLKGSEKPIFDCIVDLI